MISRIHLKESAGCEVIRAPKKPADQIGLRGVFHVEHWRKGQLIGMYEVPNLITNEGKNKLLDVMFHNVTQITTWYILLIDGAGSPTVAAGDTYAQINGTNGWDEFDEYDEATRQEWTEGAASSQSITNASPVVFTINASGSVFGLALVGGGTAPSTKNDSAGGGTLWNAVAFTGGTVSVADDDQLKVTYTVNA